MWARLFAVGLVLVCVALAAGFVWLACRQQSRMEAAGPECIGQTPEGAKVYRVYDRYQGYHYFAVSKDGTAAPVR